MNYEEEVLQILSVLDRGEIPSSAYDTAWVARLLDIDRPLGGRAMEWLCQHQLPDGSWGEPALPYYHDRVISTLAAMTALCRSGRRTADRRQVERGAQALNHLIRGATANLVDPFLDTIGFELIVPTLVAEAESLNLIGNQGHAILGRFAAHRAKKLALLEGQFITRALSTAFSAEMAGTDHQDLLDIGNLTEKNGSVANSPSATAYYALQVRPQDSGALSYLRGAVSAGDGGAPHIMPFEGFERPWTIWNLTLGHTPTAREALGLEPHLELMRKAWVPKRGLGFSAFYSVPDSDHTSIALDVFGRLGCTAPVEDLLPYEADTHFFCFVLETDPSVSVNIHALGALLRNGYPADHPTVKKVIAFLTNKRDGAVHWADKWHLSSIYPTSHMIINCAGALDDLVAPAVEWLQKQQRPDGSWGAYLSTAEETAYALQALCIWRMSGGKIDLSALRRGGEWLSQNQHPPYPALWIGKCLYSPTMVVRSAAVNALMLVDQVLAAPAAVNNRLVLP